MAPDEPKDEPARAEPPKAENADGNADDKKAEKRVEKKADEEPTGKADGSKADDTKQAENAGGKPSAGKVDDKKADDKKPDDKKADDKKADDKKPDDKKPDDKKPDDKKPDGKKPDDKKADDKKADDKVEPKKKKVVDPNVIPKAPPWWRTLRMDPPAHMRLLLGLGLIVVVFFTWWFLTRGYDVQLSYNGRKQQLDVKVNPSIHRSLEFKNIPSPGEVFGAFNPGCRSYGREEDGTVKEFDCSLWDRELGKHFTTTLVRVLKGVGLAALFGILLGILSASHRGVNATLMPLVIFLRSVPMGALIPLTIMLFGISEPQKTRFIFLAIVPFVFSDTVKAISVVPDRYIETALTLGASRFQIIRKVLVPLALPDIITSLRFQFGLALGYITLAEQINPEYGLGMLIEHSQKYAYEHVYALLFVIAFVAFMIDLLMRTMQRGVFAWRKDL